MIHELFQKDQPVFVRFVDQSFRVGRRQRDCLEGHITDMLPTRKYFDDKRLVCWSNDGMHGRHGKRCALCRDRWSCTERLRLMLLLDGLEQESVPAILEIGHGSFDAFEQYINTTGKDKVATTTIRIGISRAQGRLQFTFSKAE